MLFLSLLCWGEDRGCHRLLRPIKSGMLAAASTLPPTGPVVLMGKVEVCFLGLGAVHEKSPLDDVLQLASAPLPPTNPFVQVCKVEKFLQPACLKKIHVMLAEARLTRQGGLQGFAVDDFLN